LEAEERAKFITKDKGMALRAIDGGSFDIKNLMKERLSWIEREPKLERPSSSIR